MGDYIQILAITVAGIILLWFGYSLFFGPMSPFFPGFFPWSKWGKKKDYKGKREPQYCPICSTRLEKGELVKSVAFPAMTGAIDRLMYIRGCFLCLEHDIPRRCPVCTVKLKLEDYLVARMFDRPNKRSHIHVLGCNYCRKTGNQHTPP
jgi:hypothetical protein